MPLSGCIRDVPIRSGYTFPIRGGPFPRAQVVPAFLEGGGLAPGRALEQAQHVGGGEHGPGHGGEAHPGVAGEGADQDQHSYNFV